MNNCRNANRSRTRDIDCTGTLNLTKGNNLTSLQRGIHDKRKENSLKLTIMAIIIHTLTNSLNDIQHSFMIIFN